MYEGEKMGLQLNSAKTSVFVTTVFLTIIFVQQRNFRKQIRWKAVLVLVLYLEVVLAL